MKRILITGANGFIGRHCLALVTKSHNEIHAISSTLAGRDASGVHWHKWNLLEQSSDKLIATIQPSHLLHLAWCTQPGVYWTSPENHAWLKASLLLADAFYKAGGQRLVSAGTCAEYSWPGECIEGVTAEQPATLYGQCKKAFSDRLIHFNKNREMSSANGRVFFLYGPGEARARLVPSVIASLLQGEPPKCTDGQQLRDFLYVEDVAHALVALLHSDVEGVVNIASGQPVTIKSLINLISRVLNSKTEVYFNALSRSPGDPDILTASSMRLNQEVGFLPKYSLEAGLTKTIAFMRSQASEL